MSRTIMTAAAAAAIVMAGGRLVRVDENADADSSEGGAAPVAADQRVAATEPPTLSRQQRRWLARKGRP